MNKVNIKLPEWDEKNLRPKTKMPLCPQCKADEFAMIDRDYVICYVCGLNLVKQGRDWYLAEEPED